MVRTNLTEILLEVTNEEIKSIANETLAKIRSRGQIFLKRQTLKQISLFPIEIIYLILALESDIFYNHKNHFEISIISLISGVVLSYANKIII